MSQAGPGGDDADGAGGAGDLPAAEPVEPSEPAEPVEPRRYPSTVGGLFYLLVLTTTVLGIGLAYADDWRLGVRVLGVGLGAAAALRLVLPERDAGMLAVRHRLTDVALLAATGAALFFLAGDIPDQPF